MWASSLDTPEGVPDLLLEAVYKLINSIFN